MPKLYDLQFTRYRPLIGERCRPGRVGIFVAAAFLTLLPVIVVAFEQNQDSAQVESGSHAQAFKSQNEFVADVCKRIEMAAGMWTLPPAFLARLIWKESLFDPDAVSPVGAQGIAQFMPETARTRNLENPFDPILSILASANYLSELRNRFGNLGLAAAAYNAGSDRVRRWQAGLAGLPNETRDYVEAITGYTPNDWNALPRPEADYVLNKEQSFRSACHALPTRRIGSGMILTKAKWQPWGSHLAAGWTENAALTRFRRLQRKYPGILEGRTPMVVREINYSFGRAPRFQVRIGQPDRMQANQFCDRIKKAGGACLATKNPRRQIRQ